MCAPPSAEIEREEIHAKSECDDNVIMTSPRNLRTAAVRGNTAVRIEWLPLLLPPRYLPLKLLRLSCWARH
eukprot:5404178-Amphidinium_carterae.1